MTNVTVGSMASIDFRRANISDYLLLTLTIETPTHFFGDYRAVGLPNQSVDFFGFGFMYDTDDLPINGTVTQIIEKNSGQLLTAFQDFAVSVPLLNFWVENGLDEEALSTILAGNDTVTGGPFNDYVLGYTGADFFNLGAGDDTAVGGPGNDIVQGGPGIDSMSLAGTVADYHRVTWGSTTGAVPTNAAALAAEGVDKAFDVEFVSFQNSGQTLAIGPGNFSPLNYIASYADLSTAFGTNAPAGFDHYIYIGAFEGRAVSFSGWEYLASYGDVERAFGLNPDAAASHYITTGRFEGRAILFDGLEYIASYDDLIGAFGADDDAGAHHYLTSGRTEGRQVAFDGLEYIASYDDLITAFGPNAETGTVHFITNGAAEGRVRDDFDAQQYVDNYPDLQAAFGADTDSATRHFITNGFAEGRTDEPLSAAGADFLI